MFSRRTLLSLASMTPLAMVLPGCAAARPVATAAGRRRLARVAHVTDSHTQADRRGYEGTCAMWTHLNGQADKPDLVLAGGDLIFDGYARTRQRTQEQWDLYTRAMREHNRIPVRACLGNHDIWGWNRKDSETTGTEAGWGKDWAREVLEMPANHYAFDASGVRFVALDTVQPRGETGYEGGLGDEQFEWLEGELAGATTPVVIFMHIPAVHATTLLVDAQRNAENNWVTGGGALLMDRVRFVNTVAKHRRVAAVLSGHIHMVERVDYAGTAWINSGAVCGPWWQSQEKSREFFAQRRKDPSMLERPHRASPGYGLLDVYDDGSVDWRYVEYGWAL